MRIVAALGGNALLKRGEPMTAENQRANVRHAAIALGRLAEAGHQLVITHGNGPQVGLLALQAAASLDAPFPLDVLDAESAGMIGYVIQQELGNVLHGKRVATLLTQVRVDPGDSAFADPVKPIGAAYDEGTARRMAAERGWRIAPDNGRWRRVVPSPRPLAILEADVLAFLIDHGIVVICAGGGGIPVVELGDGSVTGVEAVIDKDLASALLARQVSADMLLMLTDVDAVYRDYGTPRATALPHLHASDIRPGAFAAGSMRPKLEAAIEFANATGNAAAIGRLEDAVAIVQGHAGTRIYPSKPRRA